MSTSTLEKFWYKWTQASTPVSTLPVFAALPELVAVERERLCVDSRFAIPRPCQDLCGSPPACVLVINDHVIVSAMCYGFTTRRGTNAVVVCQSSDFVAKRIKQP